jgi:uncharacterized protein YecT (DUF1311 family)
MKMPSKATTLILATLLNIPSVHAAKVLCGDTTSTEGINECMKRELLKVERKLNAKYKHVLKVLSEPDNDIQEYSASKKAVIESQKAWVKFRKNDCDAVGTMLLPPTGFGAYSLHTQCMIDYANIRINRLDEFDPDTFGVSDTIM